MKRIGPMLAMAFAVGTGACAGSPAPDPAMESPGPALTVERFLRAANANDLETMSQLFGSRNQNIVELEGRTMAERRMHVLATLLRHDDFQILSQEAVPGRLRQATELQIELRRDDQSVVVPHLVVRRDGGGWIIEKIDVEKLTQSD